LYLFRVTRVPPATVISGFFDSQYDKMLDETNAELDPQKRYEKLVRAEYYLMEQLPAIPLTIAATNWLKKPYVKGLYPNPGTLHAWKFVYIEPDPAKWDKDVDNLMAEKDPIVQEQIAGIIRSQQEFEKSKAGESKTTRA